MRYIDVDQIYQQTNNGMDIFAHLFDGQDISDPRKHFKIREEKTASARIYSWNGFPLITDYGDQDNVNGMKAIPYLMYQKGFEFFDALVYTEEVIIGKRTSFKSHKFEAIYEKREPTPQDKPGHYDFIFRKKFLLSDHKAIGRYITDDVLKKYNFKSVVQYSFLGKDKKTGQPVVHIFKSTEDYPILLLQEDGFSKIYQPYAKEKKYRFSYVGEKPKHYVFGLKQILNSPNEFTEGDEDEVNPGPPQHKPNAIVKDLFRCSGESDALNLASLGFHVYWLNSESADLKYEQFKEIDDLCENHYQVMDLDQTGQKYALQNALKYYNLYTVELPAWIRDRSDWRGNPCKDLKDYVNISGSSLEQTTYQFTVLKRNAKRVKFWQRIQDGKKVTWNVNMEFFYFFLKANGFYQMESKYHKKAGYSYVHVNGKIAEIISPDSIKRVVKRFTKDWIKSKHIMEGIELLNKINTSNQITEANLESIEEIQLNFKNFDHSNEYIHFKNASLKITKNKIEQVNHDKVPNYILGKLEVNKGYISHVCDFPIRQIPNSPIEINPSKPYKELLQKLEQAKTLEQRENINAQIAVFDDLDKYEITINDPDFIFVEFLKDLAHIHWRKEIDQKQPLSAIEQKEQNLALANLLFVMGYHCQQYKDPGKPWVTFLQDMKISEVGEASGRSGKSLISKAPTYVRASFYKSGKDLDDRTNYQFFYDGFTEFHDYIEIDDLAEYADIRFFYTQITGKREINPKNYAPFTLDYEESGKMLISTNYELPNINSSTVARMLNAGVSDYYHEATRYNNYRETRSPFSKFGKRLYDDFTPEEWNKFYNLMAYCVQLTMRFHKIQPPMQNILKRQARRAMSQGLGKDEIFLQWANDYFIPWAEETGRPEVSPDHNGYFNTYIVKDIAFENFKEKLSRKQLIDYRINKFKTHIQSWCEYWGYEFNPLGVPGCDKTGRILKNIDGKTTECFFISTAKAGQTVQLPETGSEDNDNKLPF